jgi:nucleotide-binding universal stress UspA family protein
MFAEEAAARQALDQAQAIIDSYGLSSVRRLVRGRDAGEEIVRESHRSQTEIVVLGATRRARASPRAPIFGATVQFVLKHAACRVMLATTEQHLPFAPPHRAVLPSVDL